MPKCTINPLVNALLGIGMSLDEALNTFDRWKDTDEFFLTEEQVDTTDAEVLDHYPLIYKVPYNGQHLSVEGEHVPRGTFVFREREYGFVAYQTKVIKFRSESGMSIDAILKEDFAVYRTIDSTSKEEMVLDTFYRAYIKNWDNSTNLVDLEGYYYDTGKDLHIKFKPLMADTTIFIASYAFGEVCSPEQFEQFKEWDENPFKLIDKIINQHS
jgi:hypothetical protein